MLLIMNDWFKAARKKLCGHSNNYTFIRNGKTFSGTRCAPVNNPNTLKQQAARQQFASAIAARQLILADDSLKETWAKRFQEAKKKGQTKATTLNGYIFKEYLAGHVGESGEFIA